MNWVDIEGWFEYPSFYKMCFNAVPDNGIMVEVGSWMGRSTSCMGELIKNSNKNVKFYAVDTFEGDTFDEQKRIVAELKEQDSSLFDVFKSNLEKCGVSEFVIPIQSTSLNAANQFEDNSLDFVHIDASHLYEDAIQDIRAWYPKVKPGGLITGDDYPWPGVRQAVHECFDSKTIVICNSDSSFPGQVWYHRKEGGISQMDITLYAICKNEEKNVEKFIENSKKFSHTVVVDTGSTDNTVSLLRDAGIEVYEHPQTKEEFDFSVARNQALSYVKTDWAFALDFNETVDDFYPDGLEPIEKEFTSFKHLRYDDNGKDQLRQSFEVHTRIHRTKNYKWIHAVHELPNFVSTSEYPDEFSVETTIKVTKKQHKSISKELFYLSLCEREHEKHPDEWYYVWFIFNHYFNIQNFSKALEYGQEFLNLSKPYFNTFRVTAFIKCSVCLFQLKDVSRGANYAFHAVSEAMNMGEPHLSQAFMHLNQVSNMLNNPNITIFATGFNPETLNSEERKMALQTLIQTELV
jgi:hypothetical protein